MKLKDFYLAFNKIIINHTTINDTTRKLTSLKDLVDNSDLKDKVVVDLSIVEDLELQRIKSLKCISDIADMDENEEFYNEDDY